MPQPDHEPAGETINLREFAGSLMPGEVRANQLFMFLGNFEESEVAGFLLGLFAVSRRIVDGEADAGTLETYLLEQETRAWTLGAATRRWPAGLPDEPLSNPAMATLQQALPETRVTLISSGAIRRPVDRPYIAEGYDYAQAVADPAKAYDRNPLLRVIPADVNAGELLVEHVAYDISAAMRDINVIYPIERLRELAADGEIGALATNLYAFSGLTYLKRLIEVAAPAWVEQIVADGAQAVVLVPG